MQRALCLLGGVAVAIASAGQPASASMVMTVTDVNSAVTLTCDNSTAVTLAACNARFASSVGGNFITFTTLSAGNVGDWSAAFTSAFSNAPGGPTATLDLSYTTVRNNAAAAESFIVDITGLGYTLPTTIPGLNNMTLSDSASESTGGTPPAGQSIVSTAYADGTNAGLHTNPTACTMVVSNNTSCGAPTINWTRANPAGTFSLSNVVQFNLAAGQDVNGSQNLVAGSVVPEPGSLLLLGTGLFSLGRAARRRRRA